MKKILLIPILGIFLITFVSATVDTTEVDDIFQLNEVINYAKACFNNGTYCSGSAVCNYTFFYPNKTLMFNNVQATNNGSNHNYSMFFPEIGIYQIDMVCHDGSSQGAETFYAQVTGTGFNDTLGFYVLLLVFSVGGIILGLSKRDAPITIFGSIAMVFTALYTLFYGIAGIKDVVYTNAFGIILLGFSMYILTRSTYELIIT